MSGHSKWATTKAHKSAVDSKRANLFTKLSKNITLAAKRGGDLDMNFSLRLAVDRAKASNMPKDNIDRAIKRGTGEIEGAAFEEVIYEAFGPGGIPFLITGVTDNKNRTTSDVKAILNRVSCSLAGENSVKWMFDRKGVIRISLGTVADKDALILELIDLGADDAVEEDGGLTLYSSFEKFEEIKKAIEAKGLPLEYAEVEWVAKEKQEVAPDIQEKIERLTEALNEHDDINEVYTNLK